MHVYHITEQPYPDAWVKDANSLRVNLPNRHLDPEMAADLYHRYLDEWQLGDELGLDIFVNEHHSTATCLTASANLDPRHPGARPRSGRACSASASRSPTTRIRCVSPKSCR